MNRVILAAFITLMSGMELAHAGPYFDEAALKFSNGSPVNLSTLGESTLTGKWIGKDDDVSAATLKLTPINDAFLGEGIKFFLEGRDAGLGREEQILFVDSSGELSMYWDASSPHSSGMSWVILRRSKDRDGNSYLILQIRQKDVWEYTYYCYFREGTKDK